MAKRITAILLGCMVCVFSVFLAWNAHRTYRQITEAYLAQGRQHAYAGANAVQYVMDKAITNGVFDLETLFEHKYELVEGSDPPRYHTPYDYYFERNICGLQDGLLRAESVYYAYAMDSDGYVPVHHNKELCGRFVDIDDTEDSSESVVPDVRVREVTDAEGYRFYDFSTPILIHERRWGTFRVGIPVALVENEVTLQTEQLAGAAAICTLGLAAIIFLVVRNSIRPLKKMTSTAGLFAAGKLGTRCDYRGRNELGELAQAFNVMADRIQESHEHLEGRVAERTAELAARLKELNCLYAVSMLEEGDLTRDEVLQKTVELIPQGWSYPEITAVRLVIGEKEYHTDNFRVTCWRQSRNVVSRGQMVGYLEVSYLEELETRDEGPFLREERVLLNAIADHLGKTVSRRQAEREVLESKERYRNLVESTHDWIWETDENHRCCYSSPTVVEILGYGSEEMLSRDLLDFMHADDREKLADEYGAIVEEGRSLAGLEGSFLHKQGHAVVLETSGIPHFGERGEYRGFRGISRDVTARKQAEAELEEIHKELLKTSRQAGMADVATSVLHNVGNVLNSVNVSATLVSDKLQNSRISGLSKAVGLFKEHADDLGEFITRDQRGAQLPGYLEQLAGYLGEEQQTLLEEIKLLADNIGHIKNIVSMQQAYAKSGGAVEKFALADLVEDILRMNAASFERHGIQVIRNFEARPTVELDRQKVLQILINLVRNAKHSIRDSSGIENRLEVRIAQADERIRLEIGDSGVGITEEQMAHVFQHGYTTKADGHGFGLHHSALGAQEMGGCLTADSAGQGQGATFTLELPLRYAEASA